MALTITDVPQDFRPKHNTGDLLVKFCTITFDNSYPSGGELYTPAMFGLTRVVFVSLNATTNIVTKAVCWLPATAALQVNIQDAISGIYAEAGNGTDQSLVTVQAAVYGY